MTTCPQEILCSDGNAEQCKDVRTRFCSDRENFDAAKQLAASDLRSLGYIIKLCYYYSIQYNTVQKHIYMRDKILDAGSNTSPCNIVR